MTADRDAAPAAAEGADALAELIAKGEAMKEAFFTGGDDNREAIACIEWDAAVDAALPAPPAAPREVDNTSVERVLAEHFPSRISYAPVVQVCWVCHFRWDDDGCPPYRLAKAVLARCEYAARESSRREG